jgi:hypothetical protein
MMPHCTAINRHAAIALTFGLFVAGGAHAGLGERAESVARDHATLHGTALRVTPMSNYQVHEITAEHGGRVREYVSSEGQVFATTWSGPVMPDLKVVLAGHYPDYVAGVQAHRASHHVLSVATSGMVLQIVKLPRGVAGSAHVPAMVPPGVNVLDIR